MVAVATFAPVSVLTSTWMLHVLCLVSKLSTAKEMLKGSGGLAGDRRVL